MASLKDLLVMGPARFLGNTYHDTITANTLTSDVLVRNKAHILTPGGGTFTTRTSKYTGFLKITLPCSWTNVMLRFYVDIYNHGSTAASTTYVISGYPKYDAEGVNNGWLSTSVFSLGGIDTKLANLPVTFGHDGSHCAIYIGATTTEWNYPQVIIRDVTTGFITSNEIFQNGWNISFTTDNLPVVNSRIEKPHVAEEANHAKLASEADELSSYSLQAAGATNPDTNPAPHIWNPLTWTIKKNWGGGGGIYALADREGYFFGIFQVKVRISENGHSAFINNKKVDWLSTSHETGVPTLTLTEEIIERGNDTTAPEVVFRLYVTAPSGNRSYNFITITETKGNIPVRNANKVSSITPAATTEAPHVVSSSTAIAFMANKWTESKNFTISGNAGNTGTMVNGQDDVTLILPQEIKNFTNIESEQFKLTSNRSRSLIYFHMKEEEQTSARVDLGIMGTSSSTTSTGFIRVFSKNTSNNNSIPVSGTQYYRDYYFTAPPDMISNQGVAVFTNAGGTIKGNLYATNSSTEIRIGTRYNNDSGTLYMYGYPTQDLRGLWDTKANAIIQINENNFVRFHGTANKADILATSRNFTISSTAGTTGTNFNGSADVSLIIPSSVSGFTTLSGTSSGVFNIIGKSTLYLSSGSSASLIFCRGGAGTSYEVGRFDTSSNFIVKNTIQGKLLQINRTDSWPYLSLAYGGYSQGTCYLTGGNGSNTARMGFYVYSKNSATNKPTEFYTDFRLPTVSPDLAASNIQTILTNVTGLPRSGGTLTGSLFTSNTSAETSIGAKYSSTASFYMYANQADSGRGIYDTVYGSIISVPASTGMAHFNGTALALKNPITIRVGNVSKTTSGNGDILSYPNPLKFASYGSDTANTKGWYKVGTWEQTGHADINLNLLVTSGYSRRAVGILCVSVRTSASSTACTCQALKWLSRFGFGVGDFRFVDNGNNSWSLYVYQSVNQWGRIQIQILTETGTSAAQQDLTLTSNTTRETTEPSSAISSTDGNFIYSTTAPSNPYEGMIWLKPLS